MDNLQIKNIIEKLGWCIYFDDCGCCDIRKVTPAGEDFGFYINLDNFVENIKKYALDFDVNEHIKMWVEAKGNGVSGVPSVRELVEDADAIKEMLIELSNNLTNIN